MLVVSGMGKWRGSSSNYVRAPMDDLTSTMSPGSDVAKVVVAKGDEDWAQRLQPHTEAGDYRRHYDEDNGETPVCNGNGRASSAADEIHDSATVALSGAMHAGRMFASTLGAEDENEVRLGRALSLLTDSFVILYNILNIPISICHESTKLLDRKKYL